jgi:hypothetical protein
VSLKAGAPRAPRTCHDVAERGARAQPVERGLVKQVPQQAHQGLVKDLAQVEIEGPHAATAHRTEQGPNCQCTASALFAR